MTGDKNLSHGYHKHCVMERLICTRLAVRIAVSILENEQLYFESLIGFPKTASQGLKTTQRFRSQFQYIFRDDILSVFFVRETDRITSDVGLKTVFMNLHDDQNLIIFFRKNKILTQSKMEKEHA